MSTPAERPRFEPLAPGSTARSAPDLLNTVRPHERARDERPCVLVNMVSSLDGRAAVQGRTAQLGGPADIEMLLELRVIADAVLIGSGTLRAESYKRLMISPERRGRRVEAGRAEEPPAVLVSRALDLPWDAGLFQAPEQPVLVYTTSTLDPPATPAPVQVVRLPTVSVAHVLRDLRDRGVRSLLCEGGPTLNRLLLEAGALDELFLTLSPQLTADESEPAIVAGPRLAVPARAQLQWVLRHEGELFLRYRLDA